MKNLSISVVIPVLNEADNVDGICNFLKAQTYSAHEIIIVDGGSTDETRELFISQGMTVMSSTRGRGNQIHTGVLQATGDIIFVMHADMAITPEVLEKITISISADDELSGGCVGATFNKASFKFRVIRWLNILRVKIGGISFGDQGQFFRRQRGIDEGWIQAIPLMEDVELSLRMKAAGKTIMLDGGVLASTRRWDKRNVWVNAFHVIYLLSKYLFLRKFKKDFCVENFYEDYYKKKPGCSK